jgi:hypothetical protein
MQIADWIILYRDLENPEAALSFWRVGVGHRPSSIGCDYYRIVMQEAVYLQFIYH